MERPNRNAEVVAQHKAFTSLRKNLSSTVNHDDLDPESEPLIVHCSPVVKRPENCSENELPTKSPVKVPENWGPVFRVPENVPVKCPEADIVPMNVVVATATAFRWMINVVWMVAPDCVHWMVPPDAVPELLFPGF